MNVNIKSRQFNLPFAELCIYHFTVKFQESYFNEVLLFQITQYKSRKSQVHFNTDIAAFYLQKHQIIKIFYLPYSYSKAMSLLVMICSEAVYAIAQTVNIIFTITGYFGYLFFSSFPFIFFS